MQREFLHIAYLLTKHECVIIPGFGAFVAYTSQIMPDPASGKLSAPNQSLGFNPELKHNDGLLTHSIRIEQEISYNEANLRVLRFSEELADQLKAQREIAIQGIGRLALSAENKIIFNPVEFPVCNTFNYGLSYFQVSLLSEIEKPETVSDSSEKNRDVIWIPLNRRILRTVGSIAATALFFLLFSTPLGHDGNQANHAVLFAPVAQQRVKIPIESKDTIVEPAFIEQELPNAIADDSATISTEEKVADANESVLSRNYYIVVASLPTLQMAESELTGIQSYFQQAAVINNGERFRIYVEQFDNKVDAEVYLDKFRSEYPVYKDAWLLSVKRNR